jgi:general nucleoside transport system permease protein
VTLAFALLMMVLVRTSNERTRSPMLGATLFALGLACGGVVIGQVALTIVLLTGTRVHTGLAIGIVAAIFIWLLLARTKWGYEIRVIGENPRAAEYAGISLARNILMVAMLSGALAGLAGLSEVLGVAHRLQKGLTVGYGYTAILVAWLAALNPWAILLWAILWAALLVGGDQIQITMGLPAAVAPSLQGLMVFCVLGGQFFVTHRIQFVRAGSRSTAVQAGRGVGR